MVAFQLFCATLVTGIVLINFSVSYKIALFKQMSILLGKLTEGRFWGTCFQSFMFPDNVIKQMELALLLKLLCVSPKKNLSSSSSNYSHILTHKHPIVIVYITTKEGLSIYLFQLYTMQSQIGRFSMERIRLSFIENLVEDLVLREGDRFEHFYVS